MPDDNWGNIGILSFPLECHSVVTHLRQDLKDDWFFDPLYYEDLLSKPDVIKETIEALLTEGNGKYPAALRSLRDVPKKGLGVRYSLETDFYDRFIYQSLCSYLIQFYDPLLSHRALGHRYDKHRKKDRYLFKNRIELWNTFEGVTFTAFKNKKALLVTDLINYFENITVDCIRRSFEEKIATLNVNGADKLKIRNAISTLCELLENWSFDKTHGLPQNRDASSFIANVVLSTVDHKMVHLGYDYYRYVDDIRIICENDLHAKKALTDLITELRTVGMNINSAKTRILTENDTAATISEFFPSSDDRTNAIDNMWRSRSKRIISRSVKYIHEIIKDCIEKKESQSRQFRFAINRLCTILDSEIFNASSYNSDKISELIIEAMDTQPASTDQFCKLLSRLPLSDATLNKIENHLCDPLKSIHGWQNYQLWYLLARKNFKSDNLVHLATAQFQNNPTSAEAPAIVIWLCATNTLEEIKKIAPNFNKNWCYATKRAFLLSASSLEKEEQRALLCELDARTLKTLSRAKGHFNENGLPLSKPERNRLVDLYDKISPYD